MADRPDYINKNDLEQHENRDAIRFAESREDIKDLRREYVALALKVEALSTRIAIWGTFVLFAIPILTEIVRALSAGSVKIH